MIARAMAMDIVGAHMRTAHGAGREHVFSAIFEGQVAVSPLCLIDESRFRSKAAYEIDDTKFGASGRATQWLIEAIEQALVECGGRRDQERVSILIGTGLREQASLEAWALGAASFDPRGWDVAGVVREAFPFATEIHCFVNACSATLACLSLAKDLLALDQADLVVVAGADSIAMSMYGLLDRANPTPPDVVRPFERSRLGVLMGEGAAAIALRRQGESEPAAVLATIAAAAQNCDARHETAPDFEGVLAAMRLAHAEAGISPGDIDLILAHGTGTILNDANEARALTACFGADAAHVMVAGLKAATGHTAGPSGLQSVVAGIEILRRQSVPPQPTLHDPIDDIRSFDIVTSARQACLIKRIQINAFGFGGVNGVTILEQARAA